MAYRLELNKSIPLELQRVFLEEIDSAIKNLGKTDSRRRDEAVHEARKSIKKLRGLLRLVRPGLGDLYGTLNRNLRDTGRKLSELRDAHVLVDTFEKLIAAEKPLAEPAAVSSVRQRLRTGKRHSDAGKLMRDAASQLLVLRSAAAAWPLYAGDFAALIPGLEATFRSGRKALKFVTKHPSDEAYHELRKRVKDYWYHVRLLQKLWPDETKSPERNLKSLETALGDDHNLALLTQTLHGFDQADGRNLVRASKRQQKALRSEALTRAREIYAGKPKSFVKTLITVFENKYGS